MGSALILPLEERFPPWDPVQGTPAGVIVLGGAIYPEISAACGQVSLDEAAERLTAAVELARQYPTARIVFSGGSANLLSACPKLSLLHISLKALAWHEIELLWKVGRAIRRRMQFSRSV